MIRKESLDFLNDLKNNNTREWFQANRPRYEAARENFLQLISALAGRMSSIDPDIGLIDPEKSVFRIYRDVRFSKDKSPYKINMGAHLVRGGKKSGNAGYYFHLEPGSSFAGGGIWQPMSDRLKLVRKEIYENIEEFRAILNDPEFRKHFGGISGDKLKTAPKGFDKDWPDVDLLKFKSYTVFAEFSDKVILSDHLADEIEGVFRAMYPLNRFINFVFESR